MTIEKSSASAGHAKAVGRSEAHGAKAAASDAGAPAGGFGSILGALGDAVDAGAATPAAVSDTAAAASAAADLPAPFDASLMLQQNPQIAAALAAPAAKDAKDAAPALAVADPVTPLPTPAVDLALLAMAGQLPPAPPVPADARSKTTLTGAAKSADAQATGALTANTQSAQSAQPAESPTQTLQHGHGGKDSAWTAAVDTAASNTVANTATAQAAAAGPTALPDPAASLQLSKALEPILAPLLAKQDKQQAERVGSKNMEPTYGGTALGVSSPDFSTSAAPAAALASDMQVAEQVSYWVSHNVQNAEMKLDGLGASPVEVSIHVQGNEAQISFRSDEAATRGVLESAGAHLKDMLQRDGLVLTGVFVGSSGSGDAGGGASGSERRARQGARPAAIAPLQMATVEIGRRMAVPAGRSVDLFV